MNWIEKTLVLMILGVIVITIAISVHSVITQNKPETSREVSMMKLRESQMNDWTHSICNKCWEQHIKREPVRVLDTKEEPCCHCGESHLSGIYLRADPDTFPCGGNHKEEGE